MRCVWALCLLAARLCVWVALDFGVENRHVGFMLTLVCVVNGLRGKKVLGFVTLQHVFLITDIGVIFVKHFILSGD